MSSPAFALPDRQLVLDRYRPLRPLGSGGSGSVWLARDEQTGLDVALKIVAREGKAAYRAEREAEAAARLRHERCLRAYDFGGDVGHVYIAYEYVHGQTLREAMRAGALRDADAVEAAAQILDGLAHAHGRGIVHRDVKPSNVLLEEGERVSVRVLDFGLAQFDEADTLTAVGDVPGTLAYISPERLAGEDATAASDVWGVGVLLWEALAGGHPFLGVPISQMTGAIQDGPPPLAGVRPDLPARLVAAVERALHLDPSKRPAAAKLAHELREGLRDTRRPPKRRRRKKIVARSHKVHVRPALPSLSLPPLAAPRLHHAQLAAAGATAVGAAAGAAVLPFFPPSFVAAIAVLAGSLMLVAPRAGLAVALAAPILPLGNLAHGAAVAYAAAALVLLALGWRDPRTGLAFLVGPVLAPLGLIALLPLAMLPVRGAVRRAAYAAIGVLAAALAAGLRGEALPLGAGRVRDLGLAGSESAASVGHALVQALLQTPELLVAAAALGAAAAALPYARKRGPWGIAGLGAGMIALTLLGAPAAPALPFVLVTWGLCIGLAVKDAR